MRADLTANRAPCPSGMRGAGWQPGEGGYAEQSLGRTRATSTPALASGHVTPAADRYSQRPRLQLPVQQSVSVSQSSPVWAAVEQTPLGLLTAAKACRADNVNTVGAR